MPKLTILLSNNNLDALYHALTLAISAKALSWDVKVFVVSQAVAMFLKSSKPKFDMPFFARLYIKLQMKKLKITDAEKMLDEAIKEGVEFYVDEVGLKVIGAGKEDLKEGVKLSGSITFLTEARESDVVLSL
ncbi:DsrE/DsrF/DrsH-like family protein [Stygiolobus caldivivus]|uniref:Peroxiredoxin n=1 Tax=Stygiolobus caldivivus TaxID=2824673 RepID=A0A8D5U8C1_9CREN|nr:DsrE/DsrF/DrsH-like family protein [Stygiolobus caldivivus]BCU70793.1 peroxiredoxin [Stygiolobus caldivivus]